MIEVCIRPCRVNLLIYQLTIVLFTEFLRDSFDEYVEQLPIKTKVLRQTSREGLVAARLLGAKFATGEVRNNFFSKINTRAGNVIFSLKYYILD